MSSSLKMVLILIFLVAIVFAGVAFSGSFSGEQGTNDPFFSLTEVNEYTQRNFGFSFGNTSSAISPIALVCNERAPKNPTETDLDQFTYCQNDGSPFKVSLAWRETSVAFLDYLNRIANTVMEDKKEYSGTFTCIEDTSSSAKNSFPGRISDCTITTLSGNSYYFSAFFFYPPTHPEISQVLYVYNGTGTPDESSIKATVRDLAGTVVF